ncbi:3-keto-disaccharide hydrolase [Pedobacter duraquae]|uniref:Uncharacterized protein DUF1080 n=1 Tax=Pedobacter duraquae TaxID=425511 RepID=A0A4V3C2Y0_9SPHI|nr:DUF1080 domain-containing protein [Pedobacter duraquae]TDO19699.1 uncharacterized protein DUF1080 [Pedobacter duraquae]
MKAYILPALAAVLSFSSAKVQAQQANVIKGWHSYGQKTAGSGWREEKGVIHLDPKLKNNDGGDLVTDKEYGNFELKLEWKVAPNANSGILFFVQETPEFKQTYSTGPEMQVLDNDGHPDGKINKHRAGDLYDLIKSSSEPVKAVGEWNKVVITSKNGKLEFTLNGVKIVSTTMWDDNWKALIAGSKFATWPGFGTFKKGRIALQDHGDEVWFRNISIKEL